MSNVSFDDPVFCGQCGRKLPDDKICRNPDCPASGQKSSLSYSSHAPTILVGGQPQSPITPVLNNRGLFAPQPVPIPHRQLNKIYLFLALILVILLVGTGILLGMRLASNNNTTNSNNTQGHSNSSGTVPAIGNDTTPVAEPTQTPTPTPTPSPSLTPSPTPSSTSSHEKLLYQADWSRGLNGWNGQKDWYVTNGVLRSDGSDSSGATEPTIVAPYYVTGTADYAVETQIQIVRGSPCMFISLRASSDTNGWKGYKGGVCDGVARIQMNDTILASTPFDPGNIMHTYRVEVKGTTINFIIDGGLAVTTNDNSVSSGGQVGLKALGVQVDVTEFKVFAL